MFERSLLREIEELALSRGKMAFISGPRQSGKTTLAKMLIKGETGVYYNWDELEFRRRWTKSPLETVSQLKRNSIVIFDEIHKASKWKQNLKGLYDTLGDSIQIIVTGSARLDLYKKGSDSLMGRYLGFRLHPFSLGELENKKLPLPEDFSDQMMNIKNIKPRSKTWDRLESFGGFPEPLFSESSRILKIWQKGRIDKIVREDLRDLSRIPELSKIEMMIALLPERVSSPVSLNSLREDLEVSYDTARRWINYLKQLYYCYEIKPWSNRVIGSLKKQGKLYLWDWSEVINLGARFENMVASHLLKACHYWTDTGYGVFELHTLKTKSGEEIDFLVTWDKKPWLAVECKLNQKSLSPHFFSNAFKNLSVTHNIQLVRKSGVNEIKENKGKTVQIISADRFFLLLP